MKVPQDNDPWKQSSDWKSYEKPTQRYVDELISYHGHL
jgi:hypothetical protein